MKAPAECTSIGEVRAEIDRIDASIIDAIAQRQEYVRAIMRFKRHADDVQAPARQAEMMVQRRQLAAARGVQPELIETIFRVMVDHFIAEEMALLAAREEE